MLTVTLMKGLPGSGKSTWTLEELKKHPGRYKRVSKDELRAMLDGGEWGKKNEQFILKIRNSTILQGLADGYHLIVDDTNLHPKHEREIRELVRGLAEVKIKDFTDVDISTCIERDLKRARSVGEHVIRQMYRQFLQPPVSSPQYDHALPDAIIVDLDGTMALLNGRSPYDTTNCENDLLNEPIADIVAQFKEAGYIILFTSGRKEVAREATLRWLKCHNYDYPGIQFELFMRQDNDDRKDAIVKRELYERHIQGRFNVKFVLDDRDQVIDLWRSLGLTALQVADGDF